MQNKTNQTKPVKFSLHVVNLKGKPEHFHYQVTHEEDSEEDNKATENVTYSSLSPKRNGEERGTPKPKETINQYKRQFKTLW